MCYRSLYEIYITYSELKVEIYYSVNIDFCDCSLEYIQYDCFYSLYYKENTTIRSYDVKLMSKLEMITKKVKVLPHVVNLFNEVSMNL